MRGEQPLLFRRRFVPLGQPRQEAAQGRRRVTDAVRQHEALLVRFELLATAEARVHHLERLVDERVQQRGVALERLVRACGDQLVLLNRGNRVLFGDVDDFMREHARELAFVAHQRQRAARDVDEAARRGERVHAVGIEHDEGPRQLRPGGRLGKRRSHQRHVLVHGGILDDPVAHADALADAGADSLFVFVGNRERLHLIAGLLRLFHQTAELRRGGSNSGNRNDQYEGCSFHMGAFTSKIETGCDRPFTVISPTLGNDRCRLIENGRQLDCRLDGRASDGRIVRWSWALEVQERITTERPDSAFNEIDVDCDFVEGRTGTTDSDGKYTTMSVDLEVTDKDGDRNRTSRNVRLYFDGVCEEEDDD